MVPNSKKVMIAMAKAEMSTNALCKAAGISQSTVTKFKNGKRCKPEIFGKIAKALKVDVMELIED